jgi:hypothetical protein
MLRLLQNARGAKRLGDRGDLLGLVTYDHHRFFCFERSASAKDVLEQRASSSAMQDFGETGFEARASSGGKDNDS